MHNLTHAANITEGQAMNLIFDACSANPKREGRDVGSYTVKFKQCAFSVEHEATVYDANGFVQAHAFVDETDV